MFVLDTNVVSELMKPQVEPSVELWVASHARDSLYTTTLTQSEILYGVAILPKGARSLAKIYRLIELRPGSMPRSLPTAGQKESQSPSSMPKLLQFVGFIRPSSLREMSMTLPTAA